MVIGGFPFLGLELLLLRHTVGTASHGLSYLQLLHEMGMWDLRLTEKFNLFSVLFFLFLFQMKGIKRYILFFVSMGSFVFREFLVKLPKNNKKNRHFQVSS